MLRPTLISLSLILAASSLTPLAAAGCGEQQPAKVVIKHEGEEEAAAAAKAAAEAKTAAEAYEAMVEPCVGSF